jgi:predicted nucleic acid-binding protein
VIYLLDKSAWMQAQYSTDAARRLATLVRRGELGLCTMTAMEILYSTRNSDEYNRDYSRLTSIRWFELSAPRRAVELQHGLAQRGWHRTSIPDVVVAATAAEHDLTVLHYDGDYERLATVAGTHQEWILPRGTGHGRRTTSDLSPLT